MAVAKKSGSANVESAADLLADLNDLAAPAPKKKSGATKERWELKLDAGATDAFNRWIEAKTVNDVVEVRMSNSKDELNEFCIGVIAEHIFKNKSRPSNPEIKSTKVVRGAPVTDHTAIFQLQDRFKFRFPDVPEGISAKGHYVRVLVDLGLEENDAENFVTNELTFAPSLGFRSLTSLIEGHTGENRQWIEATEVEKEAGRKLAKFLKWRGDEDALPDALTPAEVQVVIERKQNLAVKAGFYDRVATYVHSAEQLKALFTVVIPICFPSSPKFGVSDTPESKHQRLVKATADVLGVSVGEE